jgi:hypothetical protein
MAARSAAPSIECCRSLDAPALDADSLTLTRDDCAVIVKQARCGCEHDRPACGPLNGVHPVAEPGAGPLRGQRRMERAYRQRSHCRLPDGPPVGPDGISARRFGSGYRSGRRGRRRASGRAGAPRRRRHDCGDNERVDGDSARARTKVAHKLCTPAGGSRLGLPAHGARAPRRCPRFERVRSPRRLGMPEDNRLTLFTQEAS